MKLYSKTLKPKLRRLIVHKSRIIRLWTDGSVTTQPAKP